jgi:hypothetical protein
MTEMVIIARIEDHRRPFGHNTHEIILTSNQLDIITRNQAERAKAGTDFASTRERRTAMIAMRLSVASYLYLVTIT